MQVGDYLDLEVSVSGHASADEDDNDQATKSDVDFIDDASQSADRKPAVPSSSALTSSSRYASAFIDIDDDEIDDDEIKILSEKWANEDAVASLVANLFGTIVGGVNHKLSDELETALAKEIASQELTKVRSHSPASASPPEPRLSR